MSGWMPDVKTLEIVEASVRRWERDCRRFSQDRWNEMCDGLADLGLSEEQVHQIATGQLP